MARQSHNTLQQQKVEKQSVVEALITTGVAEITVKYGADGIDPKPYHNQQHTSDVMAAARLIGGAAVRNERITTDDLLLLELAACYHDIVHGFSGGQSEAASIEEVKAKMQEAGVFTVEDINKVASMIGATVVSFPDGKFTQSAHWANALEELMADADMSALGREFAIYWDRSCRLLLEQKGIEFTTLNPAEQQEFITAQLRFLLDHRYYTQEARDNLTHKNDSIVVLMSMLDASLQ